MARTKTKKRKGNRYQRFWTQEKIVQKIKEWHSMWDETPRRSDWSPWHCRKFSEEAEKKASEWRERVLIFEGGEWPSCQTVLDVFGSWNAAIEAAGHTPREKSQRTARGAEPSSFLIPLSHAMNFAYQAEDLGDPETLRIALMQVSHVAKQLADQILESEEAASK